MIRPKDPTEVNVDTTVQSKAIALPTDSRLYSKMLGKLVRESRNAGLVLRQSYVRVTKYSLVMQGRYAKARQMNRARKCQKKLHTNLGRLTREISRKLEGIPDAGKRQNLLELLAMADRLLQQTKTTSPKIYSLHEPDVECIAKGKPHKKYEFGNKVSLVVTSQRSWIVGVEALQWNPYDGHTLVGAIKQSVSLTNVEPKHIMVDKGYRGHKYQGVGLVHFAGRIPKMATRTFRKMLKRRSAIEPTIGHQKSDHRLERNFLKGIEGDKINALMSAIGYNFRKLLRALACTLVFNLKGVWRSIVQGFWRYLHSVLVKLTHRLGQTCMAT